LINSYQWTRRRSCADGLEHLGDVQHSLQLKYLRSVNQRPLRSNNGTGDPSEL
jgi:hypothetical protein